MLNGYVRRRQNYHTGCSLQSGDFTDDDNKKQIVTNDVFIKTL